MMRFQKGVQEWWGLANGVFAEEYKSHIDALISKANPLTIPSSFMNMK
jgi:hypothetical protein